MKYVLSKKVKKDLEVCKKVVILRPQFIERFLIMDIKPKKVKNNYETTFVVAGDLTEQEHKEVSEKFLNILKNGEADILNVEQWGLRRLAYPINAKFNGYYTFVEFNAFGELIEKLEREYRYDERVIRFLTVRLDKHAVAYNNKRREQGFGMRQGLEAK